MKTTIEIPDALFRSVKATAASEGRSMKSFVTEALQDRIAPSAGSAQPHQPAWRRSFGGLKHQREALRDIQALVDAEFERIDPEDWR